MNDLAPCYERTAGQVVFEGLRAGAAGEASIEPVPGLELAFDRVDGRLCRAAADTVAADPVAFDQQVAAMLTRLFGSNAIDVALGAAASRRNASVVNPEPELTGTLSSLARLEAAQVTSPVTPKSPWWAAEAAELAVRAGLAARAGVSASRALPGLIRQLDSHDRSALPERAVRAARGVAESCAATYPEMAGQLLTAIGDALGHAPPARHTAARPVTSLDVADEIAHMREEHFRPAGPQWLLDPARVPAGLFRFGLSPSSDLFVRWKDGQDGVVVVSATLAPEADCDALSRCVARLVDPPIRRIIAQDSFVADGSAAVAELELTMSPEERPQIWIEVAAEKRQPVLSARGHWASRARRWADAALRAERAPAGIDPRAASGDWAALAVAAWDRCRRDWAAAGDASRSALAASRRAAVDAGIGDRRLPSVTAEVAACREAADGPSYLAEVVGH
jgi:hypothetical protein